MSTTLKPAYGSSSALTTTNLQSLASNPTWTTGWSSAVQDNTSNLYDDVLVTGTIKMGGSSATANTVCEIWAWAPLDDTPTYPDTITGSEASGIALTSANVKLSGAFKRLGSFIFDPNASRVYPFSYSLANAFDGYMPKKWGLFITHNAGVALNASGNVVSIIPLQYQNV